MNISDFFKPYIDRLKDTLSGKSNGKEKYAYSIVINNGKILLLRRSILDSNPSQWSLPGGHVDSGEDFNEAAKRELREETNLDADECTLVFVKDKPEVEVHYFLCNVSNQDLMMLDNNEHYNYKWCNYQEWNDLDLVFDLKDTLNNLFPNLVEEDKEKIRLESELVKAHCRISKLFDEGKLNEDIIFKSTYLCKKADVLEQAMLSYSEIKKGGKWAQFGEVRQWGGFKYQKQQDGNWSKVANASTNPENGGELNEKENNKGNKDEVFEKAKKDKYYNMPVYTSLENYNSTIKPLIEQFFSENQELLKSLVYLDIQKSFEIIKKGFDDGIVSEEMYFDALEKVQPYLEIAKARKNYQVGEISQSTGLKKVAPGKWIDPKTGKKANPDDQKGEKGDKKEETQKDASQYSDKELENHAKETDTESLRQAAEGSNEKLRVEAKKELARREKEEIAQEGKGSKEIEESPKKDVKIDPSFVELNKKHELSRLPVNIPKDDVEVNDGSKKGNWILKWVDPKTGKTVTAYSKEFLKKNAQDKWKRIQSVSKEDVEGIRDKSKGLMSSDDSGVAQSAAIINIIANSGLRPGSKSGFKETENRGVSTLAVENVKVDGDSVSFEFVGKSYKTNTATIESPELAEYLTRQMKGKSGSDFLFDIDISNVRDVFKKDVSQSEDMKLKDMRTYVATDMARKILFEDDSLPPPLPEKGAKKAIQDKLKKVFKMVSDQLNNTPNMAKASYIHPNIINSWLTTLGTSDADMYMIKSLSVDIFKSSDSEVKGDDDEEVEEGDDQYLLPDWWDEAITPMGGDNTSTLDEIKQLL